MYSNLYKAADLLIESVNNYLGLFKHKKEFTAEDVFNSMVYHYKEVKMIDIFIMMYPQEVFILSFDELYISLHRNHKNFLTLSFMRAFKFSDDTDETIEIRITLDFDSINCYSYYSENIVLNAVDLKSDEDSFDKLIKSFKSEMFYEKIKFLRPDFHELRINYNV